MLINMSNAGWVWISGVNNMSISIRAVINIFTEKTLLKVINILCTV
ncbi:hypothetical protein SATMO3_00020 [Sporomusa aerivorans]